jgi:catechol 2,3-dioxygenase-like lactoylglutathione lyase family enzyme
MPGIRHIEFWVSNLRKSLDFYKKLFAILGWEHVDENGFSGDGVKIYFLEMKGVAINKTLGPRHICFQAKDQSVVDEVGKNFQANSLHGPAVLHPNGSYMTVFTDPDGYILEVAHKA